MWVLSKHSPYKIDCLCALLAHTLQRIERHGTFENVDLTLKFISKRMVTTREGVIEQAPKSEDIHRLGKPCASGIGSSIRGADGWRVRRRGATSTPASTPASTPTLCNSGLIKLDISPQNLWRPPPNRAAHNSSGQETRLVQFKLLTQPKIADHHPVPAVLLCFADQNVLRFDIPMDNLQRVQVLQAGRNLLQRTLGIKRFLDLLERTGSLDDVRKRGGAELECYVEKIVLALLVEVPDHVGVVVRFLQDGDLPRGDRDELLLQTFYSHSPPLQGTLKNDRAVRAPAWW
jgi:hypothetical protein